MVIQQSTTILEEVSLLCRDHQFPKTTNFQERPPARSENGVFSSHSGVDISLLSPCQGSLQMHIMRSNQQAMIWRHAHHATPNLPSSDGHGWDLTDGLTIEIVWTEGDLLPQELEDIVVDTRSQPGRPKTRKIKAR